MISATHTLNAAAAPAVPVADLRELGPYALLIGLASLLLVVFVGAEQGAIQLLAGSEVHEFVHDGRHLLGFPCH